MHDTMIPVLRPPFPSRGAVDEVRDRLVRHLSGGGLRVGEKLATDTELVQASKLSRSTVRRALTELQKQGWIERRGGRGSFVGPRVGLSLSRDLLGINSDVMRPSFHISDNASESLSKVVRLAVVVHLPGNTAGDWYSGGILRGIDSVAAEHHLSCEVLGERDDWRELSKRLRQTRPDAVALLMAAPWAGCLLAEAERFGIPVFLTGTRMNELGCPAVVEDGRQGGAMAVDHLVEQGHRRIGFIQSMTPAKWVFHRRAGFMDGMHRAGLQANENSVLWVEDPLPADAHERIAEFVAREHLTAVVCGAWFPVPSIARLVAERRLRVPQDLSVVNFDQCWNVRPLTPYTSLQPTVVALPLEEMGRQLAKLARAAGDQIPITSPAPLPCALIQGNTVAKCEGV